MIVYRLDTKGLAIADPNYPGSLERRVEYADGKFSPYNSGANADEIAAGNGKAYESIQYFAKTAMVDWRILAQRWEEFQGWDYRATTVSRSTLSVRLTPMANENTGGWLRKPIGTNRISVSSASGSYRHQGLSRRSPSPHG
jgi:hypothetical protein